MKNAKFFLKDKTIPRIGMIVRVVKFDSGQAKGTITKIMAEVKADFVKPYVMVAWIEEWKKGSLTSLYECIDNLRKATPEEKKEWRKFYRMYGPKKSDE